MRKLILFTLIGTFALVSSCSDNDNDKYNDVNEQETALTQLEIDDLKFLREEEKLARDVYLYSYNLYGLQIFKNISNSEQQHMDSVLKLLNSYNLEDPASAVTGVFNNPELQSIYNNLIEKSKISLLEALKVGNTIEDLDINDIIHNEERTSNLDLLNVYSSLKCGSRNHLRNFNNQVEQNNGTYEPIYISTDEFEAIVSTSNEKCGIN
jgi:hypothetical protein